jgi:hypothetical protein
MFDYGCRYWMSVLDVGIGCRYWMSVLDVGIGCRVHPNPNRCAPSIGGLFVAHNRSSRAKWGIW